MEPNANKHFHSRLKEPFSLGPNQYLGVEFLREKFHNF